MFQSLLISMANMQLSTKKRFNSQSTANFGHMHQKGAKMTLQLLAYLGHALDEDNVSTQMFI